MKYAAAISVLLLAGCAAFPAVEPVPPSYLSREPTAEVRLIELILVDMNSACRRAGGRAHVNGCAWPYRRVCIVFVPKIGNDGVTAETRAEIETHEIQGHCNGLRQ